MAKTSPFSQFTTRNEQTNNNTNENEVKVPEWWTKHSLLIIGVIWAIIFLCFFIGNLISFFLMFCCCCSLAYISLHLLKNKTNENDPEWWRNLKPQNDQPEEDVGGRVAVRIIGTISGLGLGFFAMQNIIAIIFYDGDLGAVMPHLGYNIGTFLIFGGASFACIYIIFMIGFDGKFKK